MKKESLQSQPLLAYTTVLPTLLFSISQIILHAIVPQVIVELVCLHESGSVDCDGSDVSGKASLLNLASATIISVPNVLVIGFYASFSKRYGLKPTLLTPVLGNLLFLSSVFFAKLWPRWYKPLIMVGSLISGLSGSRNTFMLGTFAYAADVSAPQERSNVFSVIESAIYLARVFCPWTIGVLSHRHGFGVTLGIGMAVCACNLLWIWFAMRDPGSALVEGACSWPMSYFSTNINTRSSSSSNNSNNSSTSSPKGGSGGPANTVCTSVVALFARCCGRLPKKVGQATSPVEVGIGGTSRPLSHRISFADRDGGRDSGSRDALEDNLSMLPSTASIVIHNLNSHNDPSDADELVDLDLHHDDPSDPCMNKSPSHSHSHSHSHSLNPTPKGTTHPTPHPLSDLLESEPINPHLSVGAARPAEKLAWHPLETFRSVAKVFGKNSIGNPTVPLIAATYFVYHMVVVGVHTVEILFVKYVFKWGADSIGLFGSIHGLMEIISMLAMPVLVSKVLLLSLNDLSWIELGLFARAVFFGLFGVVRTGPDLFLILFILTLCGPVVPRIKSYLSKSVDPDQSNDLFAALAGIDAISAFVSPLFTAVYFHTLLFYPGLVFELVALLFLLCALIVFSVRRGFGRDMMGYLPLPDIHTNATPRNSEDALDRDRDWERDRDRDRDRERGGNGSNLPTPSFREKDSPSFTPEGHSHGHGHGHASTGAFTPLRAGAVGGSGNGFFRVLSGQLRRLGSTGGLAPTVSGKQGNPGGAQ